MKRIKLIIALIISILSLNLLAGCSNIDNIRQDDTVIVEEESPNRSIYLAAKDQGYSGTYEEWLESIKGDMIELRVNNRALEWKTNTTNEWKKLIDLEELVGHDARLVEFKVTIDEIQYKYAGDTEYKVLLKISDLTGEAGKPGKAGATAYEIAKELGFSGTKEEWLATLNGDNGLSAYEIYLKYYEYNGTEEEWLDDLASGKLAIPKCNVTFNTNCDIKLEPLVVEMNHGIEEPIIEREGYNFEGWFDDFGNKWNFDQFIVRHDMKLEARWQERVLKVVFDPNMTGYEVEEVEFKYGAKLEIPLLRFNEKYYFKGYFDEAGKKYSNGDILKDDLKLTGRWGEATIITLGGNMNLNEIMDKWTYRYIATHPEVRFHIDRSRNAYDNFINNTKEAVDFLIATNNNLESVYRSNNADIIPAEVEAYLNTIYRKPIIDAARAYDGTLASYPIDGLGGPILYYNKSMLEPNTLGSIESISNVCAGKKINFSMSFQNSYYTDPILNALGHKNTPTFDTFGNIISVSSNLKENNIGVNYARALKSIRSSNGFTYYENENNMIMDFASNKLGCIINGFWQYSALKEQLGDNLGVLPLPSFKLDGNVYKMKPVVDIFTVMVNKNSPHKAIIYDFLNYFISDEIALERLINKDAFAVFNKGLDGSKEFNEIQAAFYENSKSIGSKQYLPQNYNIISSNFNSSIINGGDVALAIDTYVSEMAKGKALPNAIISNALDKRRRALKFLV